MTTIFLYGNSKIKFPLGKLHFFEEISILLYETNRLVVNPRKTEIEEY